MSQYTTGEIARLCGVSVRTVQYYDARGILVPAALSDGGRRLYSEDDVRRMKVICFLRELGLRLDSIAQLLSEDDPGSVISLLLDQQEQALREEIGDRQVQLDKLESLKYELKSAGDFSVETIGDIAYTMSSKKELKKIHRNMLLSGLPISALQVAAVVLWITNGLWWLILIWAAAAIPYGIWVSRYYFNRVAYICPQCHTVFKPTFKEMFWGAHTPSTRKLTCASCGHRGFCVEVAAEAPQE